MAKGNVMSLAAHRRKREQEVRKAPLGAKEQAFAQFFLGPYLVSEEFTVDYARSWPSLEEPE